MGITINELFIFINFWLAITSIILLLNLRDFKKLPFLISNSGKLKISVLIPARNEETVIERCIRSVLNQSYKNIEIIVLDDGSEDRTHQVISNISDSRLCILNGQLKPDGWLGKQAACNQLSKASSGDILLFVDADVWLENNTVAKIAETFQSDNIGFLSVWPRQIMKTFWENTIVSSLYHTLFTLLPVRYIRNQPKWLPISIRAVFSPYFAAACGQLLAFRRDTYNHIGGHEAVKNAIVEDVAFARIIKRAGINMNIFHGGDDVLCRMYTSEAEIRQGFRKNFLAGFDYNITFFVFSALLHFVVFILPVLLLPVYPKSAIIALIVPVLQRLILSRWYGFKPIYSLIHILSVLWFQFLGIIVLTDYLTGKKITWKGRTV